MDSTEEILIEYGVHLGYRESRLDLARDMEKGGLTGGDLRMVCNYVRDSGTSKSQGPRISAVLSDKDRWGPLLTDLRKFHEIRHRKEARMGKKKQEPGKGVRETDSSRAQDSASEFFGMGKEEYQHHTNRWQDFNPTLNQAELYLRETSEPDVLRVDIDTETPCFEAFDVQIDDGAVRAHSSAAMDWKLHEGLNRLRVRARNTAGRCGPQSCAEVVLNY